MAKAIRRQKGLSLIMRRTQQERSVCPQRIPPRPTHTARIQEGAAASATAGTAPSVVAGVAASTAAAGKAASVAAGAAAIVSGADKAAWK